MRFVVLQSRAVQARILTSSVLAEKMALKQFLYLRARVWAMKVKSLRRV